MQTPAPTELACDQETMKAFGPQADVVLGYILLFFSS